MRWWILAVLMGCSSGLQSTSAECKDGYERGEDGSCYAEDGDGENGLPGGSADNDDGDADDGGPTGGDAGGVDEGAPADDPPGDGDGDDDFDDSCEAPEDCSMDRCPDGSIGCTCLILDVGEGICAPTCNTAADCPELGDEVFVCTDDGICDLPVDDG